MCMACADSGDSIDYTKSHTATMNMLDEADICILAVDLLAVLLYSKERHDLPTYLQANFSLILQSISTPQHSIHRFDPKGSYNTDTLTAFFRTVDTMTNYPNTLGVLSADYSVNNENSECCTTAPAAILGDLKVHMAVITYRIHSYFETILSFRYHLSKFGPINFSLSNSDQSYKFETTSAHIRKNQNLYEFINPKDMNFSLKVLPLFYTNW